MPTYSLNKRSVILSLFYSLVLPIFGTLLIGSIYIYHTEKIKFLIWLKEGNTMIAVLIIILTASIPAVYIFLEYLYFNRTTIIQIDDYKNEISIIDKSRRYSNSIINIKSCTIYKETKGWAFFPCSNFSFARLVFIDGHKEDISCLLKWDLHVLIGKITFIEKRSVFPSILLYKLFHK